MEYCIATTQRTAKIPSSYSICLMATCNSFHLVQRQRFCVSGRFICCAKKLWHKIPFDVSINWMCYTNRPQATNPKINVQLQNIDALSLMWAIMVLPSQPSENERAIQLKTLVLCTHWVQCTFTVWWDMFKLKAFLSAYGDIISTCYPFYLPYMLWMTEIYQYTLRILCKSFHRELDRMDSTPPLTLNANANWLHNPQKLLNQNTQQTQ